MPQSIRWRLVLPVKEARLAKTRLVAPAALSRPDLARAIALDTLEAGCRALPPGDVITVTSDEVVAPAAAALGSRVVPDPGEGLNAAITAGLHAAVAPDHGAPDSAGSNSPGSVGVAVLLGDLPALRPQDLLTALAACAGHDRAVVPDHDGRGTVLLTGAPGILLEPRFGDGSAARHAEAATLLTPDLPRLRRDVDDLADLAAVVRLGVGQHTTRVLEGSAWSEPTAN